MICTSDVSTEFRVALHYCRFGQSACNGDGEGNDFETLGKLIGKKGGVFRSMIE